MKNLPFRVGQGYDVHALVENRALVIGGVKIPYHLGLQGHSDADPLLHAITDALLGAAALGDIGQHFPDHDARFAGIDSQVLLKNAYAKVCDAGYQLSNIDATVIAQAPKLANFISTMAQTIADCLQVNVRQINIKAKTNEYLGHLGRGEGIAAQAVVLLFASDHDEKKSNV